jgi:tryptophan synthase beta chain
MKTSVKPNDRGYFGSFGGAFIPEMMQANIAELQEKYESIINSEDFKEEFDALLTDYVGRPSPLYFANRLSARYEANIYLKREDLNHTGSHKINNALGQIILAKKLGKKKIIAETGAGQHGVATATACALMGIPCVVFMGEIDVKRQAPNVGRMKMLGAEVVPVSSGSRTLKDATNEAMRYWIANPFDTHYIIGSVVGPHPYPDMVARFQSVISEEIRKQLLEKTGSELPDKVIACVGGGSNATGAFFNFLEDESVELIASEAAGKGLESGFTAAATFKGKSGILHGSKTLFMQTDDGQVVEPHSISAGLDYPGIGPALAHWFESGRVRFEAVTDEESLIAGMELCKLEGIIPAVESAHALATLAKLEFKKNEVVVVNLSGRGDKDLETYLDYLK